MLRAAAPGPANRCGCWWRTTTVAGELLERTVGALGWRADCVGSGSEAVARVQAAMAEGRRYDVVLMDWRMPDLDGRSAAQLIRQVQGDLPPPMVIMITAYGREVLADARDHSAPPFVSFSPSRSRPSNWPTRCCMRCTANRALATAAAFGASPAVR